MGRGRGALSRAGLHSSRFSNIRAELREQVLPVPAKGSTSQVSTRHTSPGRTRTDGPTGGPFSLFFSKGKAIRGNGLFAPALRPRPSIRPRPSLLPLAVPWRCSPASLSTSHDCTFLASGSGRGHGHGMRPSPSFPGGSESESVPELNATPAPSPLSSSSQQRMRVADRPRPS